MMAEIARWEFQIRFQIVWMHFSVNSAFETAAVMSSAIQRIVCLMALTAKQLRNLARKYQVLFEISFLKKLAWFCKKLSSKKCFSFDQNHCFLVEAVTFAFCLRDSILSTFHRDPIVSNPLIM